MRLLGGRWAAGAMVFALALAVRLIVVYQTRGLAFVAHPQGDAAGYLSWATEIAGGAWVGSEAFYQAPLYPYVLGALFVLTGPSVLAVQLIQCVWGACGSVLLLLAGRRLFGAGVGVVAGLMFAVYPAAIFADAIVQKTSLGALLTCALMAILARMLRDVHQSRRWNIHGARDSVRSAVSGDTSSCARAKLDRAVGASGDASVVGLGAPYSDSGSDVRRRRVGSVEGDEEPLPYGRASVRKVMGAHPYGRGSDRNRESAGRRGALSWFVVLGLVVGLLCLVRENALVWLGVLTGFALTLRGAVPASDRQAVGNRDAAQAEACGSGGGETGEGSEVRGRNGWRTMAIGRAAAFLIGAAVVLLPVAARNASVGGSWSLTTSQLGPNFYIGNSADADGRYRPLVRGHETPQFERTDATRLAESAMGRSLSAREVSQYWFRKALDEIGESPTRWLALMGRKTAMTVNAYEVSDVESLYVYADHARPLGWLTPVWHFGVLFPLAVVGGVLTRSSWRTLWVCHVMALSMIVAVALFFILGRYRFVLVPVLTPFAAAGVVGLWRWGSAWLRSARQERGGGQHIAKTGSDLDGFVRLDTTGRSVGLALAAGALAAIVSNWPIHPERRLDALSYMNLGVATAARDVRDAIPFFHRAVDLHPTSLEARFNLGQALLMVGDGDGAIEHLNAAIAVDEEVPMSHLVLGMAFESVGDRGRALGAYRRAVQLDPTLSDAREALERMGGG